MCVSCECCVLWGRYLCVELITRPEESYWLLCVQAVWSRSPVRGVHDSESGLSATWLWAGLITLPVTVPIKDWRGEGHILLQNGWTSVFIVQDRIPVGMRFSARPDRPWGPPQRPVKRYRVFPGGKVRPGRNADHSPPSSAVAMEQ